MPTKSKLVSVRKNRATFGEKNKKASNLEESMVR